MSSLLKIKRFSAWTKRDRAAMPIVSGIAANEEHESQGETKCLENALLKGKIFRSMGKHK